MTYYKRPHPWDSGFAIPNYIRSEAPGARGGVHTSMQLPRGTFGPVVRPKPWQSGFALPEYIKREPVGRGAAATLQARRKTIPTKLPPLGQTDVELDLALLESTPLPQDSPVQEGEEFPVEETEYYKERMAAESRALAVKGKAPKWVLPTVLVGGAVLYFMTRKG